MGKFSKPVLRWIPPQRAQPKNRSIESPCPEGKHRSPVIVANRVATDNEIDYWCKICQAHWTEKIIPLYLQKKNKK